MGLSAPSLYQHHYWTYCYWFWVLHLWAGHLIVIADGWPNALCVCSNENYLEGI